MRKGGKNSKFEIRNSKEMRAPRAANAAKFENYQPNRFFEMPCWNLKRAGETVMAERRKSLLVATETDSTFGLLRGWRHEAAQGIENGFELLTVLPKPLFQRVNFASQVPDGKRHLTQTDESAHDGDIDGGGALALQYTGEHRHAFLGKAVRQIAPATASGL